MFLKVSSFSAASLGSLPHLSHVTEVSKPVAIFPSSTRWCSSSILFRQRAVRRIQPCAPLLLICLSSILHVLVSTNKLSCTTKKWSSPGWPKSDWQTVKCTNLDQHLCVCQLSAMCGLMVQAEHQDMEEASWQLLTGWVATHTHTPKQVQA